MKPGKTRRQQMTDLLQRKSWSVYELAEEFGVKISTILDDLTYKKICLFPLQNPDTTRM